MFMSMKAIRNVFFGKIWTLLLGVLFLTSSCDYCIYRNVSSGCIYDERGDSVNWKLKFRSFNDALTFGFQSRGNNHLVEQGGTYEVDSSPVFEVYKDSLKISYVDTLDVGILDVKTLVGKANVNNTDSVSQFVMPLFVGHQPKHNKRVYLKIFPCGYLKYGGKNLITDTIVFDYIRPAPDFKNAFREIFKKKKK